MVCNASALNRFASNKEWECAKQRHDSVCWRPGFGVMCWMPMKPGHE